MATKFPDLVSALREFAPDLAGDEVLVMMPGTPSGFELRMAAGTVAVNPKEVTEHDWLAAFDVVDDLGLVFVWRKEDE